MSIRTETFRKAASRCGQSAPANHPRVESLEGAPGPRSVSPGVGFAAVLHTFPLSIVLSPQPLLALRWFRFHLSFCRWFRFVAAFGVAVVSFSLPLLALRWFRNFFVLFVLIFGVRIWERKKQGA